MTNPEKSPWKFSLFFAVFLLCLLVLSGIALPWVISSELPLALIIILTFILVGLFLFSVIGIFTHLKLSLDLKDYFKCLDNQKKE